jgi:glyoxylase-like metal-dependent hydrolase (beta-lactamase superfamily II)
LDTLPCNPFKITDHLFRLGTPNFPVYLSLGEEGMLIEGGTGPTAQLIAAQVRLLGIDPVRIRHMALTHTHPDHIGAVPRLRRLWPHMRLLAGPTAAHFLRKETLLRDFLPADRTIGEILKEARVIRELPPPLDEYPFHADRILEEGEEISLGNGISWRVFPTPGHSPCHTSFYEAREDVLVVGDATGFYDPARDVFWPNYFSSLEEYCTSIRNMAELPARLGLLAHNGVIRYHVGEYLARAISAAEEYHLELLDRVARGEDQGEICREKADWVWNLGPLASYEAILFLCGLLLKRSQKEKDRAQFFPSRAAAA